MRIDKKGFFLLSSMSLLGNILGMGFAYLLHFFMVRMLSQADYGDLSTLIAIAALFAVPQLVLQGLIAREIALADKKKDRDLMGFIFRKYLVRYSLIGLLLGFASSIIIIILFGGINTASIAGVVMLSSVPLIYMGSSILGYFQGLEQIPVLAAYRALSPILRTSLAVALVYLGLGLVGAASAFTLAQLIFLPLLAYILLNTKTVKKHALSLRKSITLMGLTNFLMMFVLYADLLFVRFMLSAGEAGVYNTAAMTAKVLFFSTNALVVVLLPKATKLSFSKEMHSILALLVKGMLVLTPITIGFVLLAHPLITLFYTSAYSSAALPLQILSVGLLLFALNTLITNVFWSQKEERIPMAINAVGALLAPLLLYFLVPSYGLVGAAVSTTIVSLLLAALSSAALVLKAKKVI